MSEPSGAFPKIGLAVSGLGTVGCVAILLRAGGVAHALELSTLLFAVWVASPLLCLVLANALSPRWPRPTRLLAFFSTVIIVAGSLLVYADTVFRPQHSTGALIFIFLPLWSLLFILVGIPVLGLLLERRHKPAPGA